MADDLEKLKARLWKNFETAAKAAENTEVGTRESRAMNRQAVGTIGQAIVALERELRERDEQTKPFKLIKGAPDGA
jgi:hypothetical protein